MRKLLKYLFPLFAAFFFCNCEYKSDSAVTEEIAAAISLEEAAYHSEISESESELCLPRQVSFANSHRLQNTSRRTSGAQKSTGIIRSGNAGIRYFVQRKYVSTLSSLSEPAYRLLCLGRLII